MARRRLIATAHPTERLVGQAPAIVALRAHIRHLAAFDTIGNPFVPTVLLHGETGTGKGLVARIIHDSGPRAQGPFLEVNCAAIPESLLEAELFGFEAGAFTDAKRAKPGLFEAASGGTLFLDEIDTLPLTLQGKLLTVIEAKRVRRLGAVAEHSIDVKLTVASQADLQARISEGRFRADLYHRLAVLLLEVPPLRERGADIVLLAQHYLHRYAEAHRLSCKRLSQGAEAWLWRYSWPGNVRELGHLMERVTLLSQDTLIGADRLEQLCLPPAKSSAATSMRTAESDTELADEAAPIRLALQRTAGNVARAARLLGISRGAFRHRMARYGVAQSSKEGTVVVPSSQQRAGRPEEMAARQVGDRVEPLWRESPASAPGWEQKPVAVLMVEVTWSSGQEGEVSPYEPWTVNSHWEKVIVEKVQGFGGVVLPHSPSLLVVAFGLPQTLEHLPQRAVQAAMTLRRLVQEAAGGGPCPALRMAIHWGQVLVDTGAADPMARLVPIGDTLARPGRLLGYAELGEIVVSPEMAQLVSGWCELRAHEKRLGSGSPEQIGAYTIIELKPHGLPLEMHGQRPLSWFVGRERELAMLEDLLRQAREGRGQVVGMVGEPGVGKSRLCYEFIRARRPHRERTLAISTNSYGEAIPYLPVIDLLKACFQIEANDALATVREKVTAKLRTFDQALEPSLSAFLSLLDVPAEDTTWQALDPSQRRQRTLDAIKRLLLWETQERPLLLVVENLHWIDGETQAVLDSLVEGLPTARLLLLVSYRPEYQHTWGSKTYYTQLRLDPLPPKRAQDLLGSLLGQGTSLTLFTPRLLEQTEGNPFFIEESVRALVETRVLAGEPGAYRLAKTVHNMHVPTTVHMVLAARIDYLPSDAKHLLQLAAVIGKEVPFSLLQTIMGGPAATLRQGLAHLQRSEFLYERSLFSEPVYTFKHALTHEVAYASVLSERRRVLHARVVEALQRCDGDRLAMHVERLAYHALRGEVWDKALVYCRQAGEKAMARSAHREAVRYLEQALSALPHLPETRDTRTQSIDLQLALCSALAPSDDSGRILACLREAESRAEALDDPPRLGQALIFLSRHFRHMGVYDQAIAAAERALRLATAGGDDPLYPQANLRLGYAHRAQGDYRRAIDYFGRTVAALDYAQRSERLGQAILPAVSSRAFIATCHAELGTFAEGRALGDEGLHISEAVAHPPSLMFAAWGVGLLALRQGDLSRALPWLEQSMNICQDADLPAWFPLMAATLGAAYAFGGRVADAMPLLTQAMEQTTARATVADQVLCYLSMGEAQALAGRLEDAYVLAGHTLTITRRHQERGNEAYALRLLGETAAQRDPPAVEPAEDHYRQAIALAEELGMCPLQAHCHLGLGTLYAEISRPDQARDELSTAIELYRSMEMTLWLPQAEATLAQVEGR